MTGVIEATPAARGEGQEYTLNRSLVGHKIRITLKKWKQTQVGHN